MSMFYPYVSTIKGSSFTRCNQVWERSRLEWRIGDRDDPAQLIADYLATYGLGLPTAGEEGRKTTHRNDFGSVCGAVLHLSAAGSASMHGVSSGRPSPAVGLPDVVAVVYAHGAPEAPHEPPRSGFRVGGWTPSWSPDGHAAAVSDVRAAIARGDVYQVNVVGHSSAPYVGDPLPALGRLLTLPGARYGGVLSGAGWSIACASPEMLVRVSGGIVETRPIKGTRPATAIGRRELLESAKERAEHIMIVDLERNDLGHVAAIGTVDVPSLFEVRRWSNLWQAESRITAELRPDVTIAELLRAMCPGGSVTGAPKLAALAQIAALEPVGRGPSMGALGWIDESSLDLGLTIRTVAADGERLHLWAGGGIVWDSDPAAEVAEAAAKAAPVRALLTP